MELVCEPVFDYGRDAGDLAAGRRRPPRRRRHRRRRRPSGCAPTSRSASRAAACAPATCCRRATGPTARCRGRRGWRRRPTSRTPTPASTATMRSGGAGWHAPASPTIASASPIQRSALAIKGLTYMPTGATVAALTTSLPETPGGERNWDYRYTWMRDSTFTLQALHWLNLDWEADEFMQFVADLEPNEDGALQIMYGIDGRRDLTESTRDDLTGYAGARPVRIGNGAFDQRQNDVFGAVLDSILLHTRRSQRLPRRLWPIVQAQAECATAGLAQARPGHLGGARRAAALRVVEADVLGGARPRRQAGRDPRRPGAAGDVAARPPRRSRPTSSSTASASDGVLRQHYDTDALDASTLLAADLRLPARRRRAAARQRAGHRRRAHRERLRAALPHRRDRRRPVGQGGHVPDLLVLAGVGAGDRRRACSGPAT